MAVGSGSQELPSSALQSNQACSHINTLRDQAFFLSKNFKKGLLSLEYEKWRFVIQCIKIVKDICDLLFCETRYLVLDDVLPILYKRQVVII